ncbi:MAG: hypothetical protein IH788_06310, partial [Nitrospinae bacterium]|nr:hypothetical protein [Nitrospinota bacterium]
VVRRLLAHTDGLRQASGCKVLFSLKPFAYVDALALMAPHLDGFATSSLFEARLASQVLLGHGSLHLTTPGMRPDDVGEIASLCDFVSFNSLSQYQMHGEAVSRAASCGLRVNPQMSFVDDERYDPCRPNSKLGVPLERLVEVLKREPHRLSGIDGILVHSNCDSSDVAQAQATVQYMDAKLGGLFERVQWVNLGGGYLLDESESLLIPVPIMGGNFDAIDTFDLSDVAGTVGVNQLRYGLTNRILSKGAEGEIAEVFRLNVSQLFDIKESRRDERSDLISLGPIEFDLESRIVPPLILNTRASYDYGSERLASLNSTVGLEVGRYGTLYTDYTFSKDPSTGEDLQSFYLGGVDVNITDAINAQYQIRYDERGGQVLENQYGLVYRGCCWSVQLTLFDRIDETKVLVRLDLKGIGSVGRSFHVGSDVGGGSRGGQRLPGTIGQSTGSQTKTSF